MRQPVEGGAAPRRCGRRAYSARMSSPADRSRSGCAATRAAQVRHSPARIPEAQPGLGAVLGGGQPQLGPAGPPAPGRSRRLGHVGQRGPAPQRAAPRRAARRRRPGPGPASARPRATSRVERGASTSSGSDVQPVAGRVGPQHRAVRAAAGAAATPVPATRWPAPPGGVSRPDPVRRAGVAVTVRARPPAPAGSAGRRRRAPPTSTGVPESARTSSGPSSPIRTPSILPGRRTDPALRPPAGPARSPGGAGRPRGGAGPPPSGGRAPGPRCGTARRGTAGTPGRRPARPAGDRGPARRSRARRPGGPGPAARGRLATGDEPGDRADQREEQDDQHPGDPGQRPDLALLGGEAADQRADGEHDLDQEEKHVQAGHAAHHGAPARVQRSPRTTSEHAEQREARRRPSAVSGNDQRCRPGAARRRRPGASSRTSVAHQPSTRHAGQQRADRAAGEGQPDRQHGDHGERQQRCAARPAGSVRVAGRGRARSSRPEPLTGRHAPARRPPAAARRWPTVEGQDGREAGRGQVLAEPDGPFGARPVVHRPDRRPPPPSSSSATAITSRRWRQRQRRQELGGGQPAGDQRQPGAQPGQEGPLVGQREAVVGRCCRPSAAPRVEPPPDRLPHVADYPLCPAHSLER